MSKDSDDALRQKAVSEIIAIKNLHLKNGEGKYTFEYCGKQIGGAFVTAGLQQPPAEPNAYFILLEVTKEVVVLGDANITDSQGTIRSASAFTKEGKIYNKVTLRALA